MGWFEFNTNFIPGKYILAATFNNLLKAIDTSFHNLPAPHPTEKGFSGPCAVGEPTKEMHAVTAGGIMAGGVGYAEDTGTANTYVITLPVTPTSYKEGMQITVKPAHDNTGASTINVNGLGAVPILDANGGVLGAGDIKTGVVFQAVYSGGYFYCVKMLASDRAYIDAQKEASEQWAVGVPSEPSGGSSKHWATESATSASLAQSYVAQVPQYGAIRGRQIRHYDEQRIQIKEGFKFHVKSSSADRMYTVQNDVLVNGPGTSTTTDRGVYLMTSVLPSNGLITSAGAFAMTEQRPTYDPDRLGWYRGDSRCLGVFIQDQYRYFYPFRLNGNKVKTGPSSTGDVPFWSVAALPANQSATSSVDVPRGMSDIDVDFHVNVAPNCTNEYLVGGYPAASGGDDVRTIHGFSGGSQNNIVHGVKTVITDPDNPKIWIYFNVGAASAQLTVYVDTYTFIEGM